MGVRCLAADAGPREEFDQKENGACTESGRSVEGFTNPNNKASIFMPLIMQLFINCMDKFHNKNNVTNMAEKKLKEHRFKQLSIWVLVNLTAMVVILGMLYLDSQGMIAIPQTISRNLSSILLVIGVLFTVSLVLRLTIKSLFNFFDEPEERIFYSKIYNWVLYGVGIFVILYHFGVSLGNITLVIGLMATGLAFAVRDVLMSFFAWMILLRKKPFRIGDYIRIGEDEGKVLHIGMFYVLLDNTVDLPEDYTRVPNRLFLEKSINNLGKNFFQEQITFQLSGMPDNMKEMEVEIAKAIANLLERKDYVKVFADIRNEKLCLVVEYLVNFENKQMLRSEVIKLIFSKMNGFISVPKN